MATLGRARVRQMDIVEWFNSNRPAIKSLAAERWKVEKGVVAYMKDGVDFFTEMRSASKERKAKKEADKKGIAVKPDAGKKFEMSALDQYYVSQELLKKMKWKRVTWENEADYDAFARRITDNDTMFSRIPALSHMCVHVIRDLSVTHAAPETNDVRTITSIKAGSLTKWFLEEQLYSDARPRPTFKPLPKSRQAPFTVDWEAGTVRILDSITAQEMLVFLESVASRVQALQVRMEEEQTKMTEDLENVRIRLGVTLVKFNKHEKTFWDDPARKEDIDNYVTPADMRLFIDSVFKRAYLLRRFVKGNQIRVIPPGKPYAIDLVEKEIRIPANFAEYNFLRLHGRYETLERFFNAMRATLAVWFFLGMMLVGDLEIL